MVLYCFFFKDMIAVAIDKEIPFYDKAGFKARLFLWNFLMSISTLKQVIESVKTMIEDMEYQVIDSCRLQQLTGKTLCNRN